MLNSKLALKQEVEGILTSEAIEVAFFVETQLQ